MVLDIFGFRNLAYLCEVVVTQSMAMYNWQYIRVISGTTVFKYLRYF